MTVNQMRPRESVSTKFVFPSGSAVELGEEHASCRPSRVIRSIASRPKSAITRSPFGAKASPFGSVPPSVYRSTESESANARVDVLGDRARCDPSGSMRTTPPRASAVQSVPSGSARMHSGRWRSRPTKAIEPRSTCQPCSGFVT